MGTIAKGEITLSPVNDAYTVLITPASCTIKADFDGSHPQLENAHGVITVKRGTRDVPFHITTPHISTGGSVKFGNTNKTSAYFEIQALSTEATDGYVQLDLVTDDGFNYSTSVRFVFTIVRESTMLDWIQDWEGSKTKVGGTYIMTPKLFVGKKEDVCQLVEHESVDSYEEVYEWISGALTGVYIGPDIRPNGEGSVGIYGYLKDQEIFHINADGGFIGGWKFTEAGLQSSNGVVNILSEGSIFAQNSNSTQEYWGIYADGHATFANGNVNFYANGSADFAGKITSTSGQIGGWGISQNQLRSNHIILDSNKKYIGINASTLLSCNPDTQDYLFPINPSGGVKMWYTSSVDFGFAGWDASANKVFQLGSTNVIAGWNFNSQAFWTGSETPYLSQGGYTDNASELTISPSGIRSCKWYIDADGTAEFVEGDVAFNTDHAVMFGWKMQDHRFSSAHAALVSYSHYCGIFVSPADLTDVSATSFVGTVNNSGGIYMYSDGVNSQLTAYDTKQNRQFHLSTGGYSQIGKWYFDHESIYIGNKIPDKTGFTKSSGDMVLGLQGLLGYNWKLCADGSGAIAGSKIWWEKDGKLHFGEGVTLSWGQITGTDGIIKQLTHIDENGIYTGTISADKISAGTISTASLKCEGKWELRRDGSGFLASNNIYWGIDGKLTVKGTIEADQGSIGTGVNKFEITSEGIAYGNVDSWPSSDTSKKMLMSPESLKIQHSNPDNANEVCKIYLGKEAWPSRASSFPYGTVAWVYKKDLRNLEMEGSRCCEPAFRIDTVTQYGGGVALSTNGAIVSSGVISEKGYYVNFQNSGPTIINLSPFNGSVFVIKNSTKNAPMRLPDEGMVRFVLDLGVGEPFVYRIIVCSLPGNEQIQLGIENTEYKEHYRNEGIQSSNYYIKANTIHEFTLVYDGNNHSYWYIKNIT